MEKPRELTITIEGGRRQGKTVMAQLLAAFLKKFNYHVVVKDGDLSIVDAFSEGEKLLTAEKEFKPAFVTIQTKDLQTEKNVICPNCGKKNPRRANEEYILSCSGCGDRL